MKKTTRNVVDKALTVLWAKEFNGHKISKDFQVTLIRTFKTLVVAPEKLGAAGSEFLKALKADEAYQESLYALLKTADPEADLKHLADNSPTLSLNLGYQSVPSRKAAQEADEKRKAAEKRKDHPESEDPTNPRVNPKKKSKRAKKSLKNNDGTKA